MGSDVLTLGLVLGLGYGLFAVGLVLTFRASRVVNFAHTQTGAFAAVVMAVAAERWTIPYWIALPFALLVGAGIGALVELAVVRRLRDVPPLLTLLATLGVAQVLLFGGRAIAGELPPGYLFPQPPGIPSFRAGGLLLTPALLALALAGPAAVAGLGLLLFRTRLGLAMRASSANTEAARLAGIPARTLVTAIWAGAAALSTLVAVLVLPGGGALGDEALGPALLLRGLAAAVLAGMTNLPGAFLAGIAVGVVDEALRSELESAAADGAMVALIAIGLLAHRPAPMRGAGPAAWSAFARWPKLPAPAREVPLVRWSGPVLGASLGAAVLFAPLLLDGPGDIKLVTTACFALVGLSVFVVTGLAGELSLGQFAIAGLGAAAAVACSEAGADPVAGVAAAALAGAAASLLLILPLWRSGPLGFAVLTLAVAVAAPSAVFAPLWSLDSEVAPLSLGPLSTSTSTGAAVFAVLMALLAYVAVRALAAGPAGRVWTAARDNPVAARSFGVWPAGVRAGALAAGGALAGTAGAVLAHALTPVSPEAFPLEASVSAVAVAIVGGLAVAEGALLGAAAIVALPAFVDLPSAALAGTAFGWLLVLLYAPGGFASLLERVRRHGAALLLRLSGHDPGLAFAREAVGSGSEVLAAASPAPRRMISLEEPVAELRAEGIVKRYGPVRAVDDVTVTLGPAEIVALVGANGAGKTTLADVLSGLERPDAGRVFLGSRDVTTLPAELRVRAGVGRSFQEPLLFPTLTASDVVLLAAERRARGRAARATVREVVEAMGLARYADVPVRELSTGTRRVVELAALLALEPRTLVLDEPSAGLAAPEAQAVGVLLRRLRDQRGLGILLVEHDLALVESVADRVLVMADGRVAQRRPATVGARA